MLKKLIVIFSSLIASTTCALTQSPVNSAALPGVSVQLNCASDSPNSVEWNFMSPRSSSMTPIYNNGTILPGYTQQYNISSTTPQYNLVILTASNSTCGLYVCVDGNGSGNSSSADVLVVTGAGIPTCTSNATATVMEHSVVAVTCSAQYCSSTVDAVMEFKDGVLNNVTTQLSSTTFSGRSVTYSVSPLASRTTPTLTCWMTFTAPTYPVAGEALNAPSQTFTANCPMPTNVIYCPDTCTLTSYGEPGGNGTYVTCSAQGNPAPTYTWTDSNAVMVSPNATLYEASIEYGQNFTCTATNNVTNTNCGCTAKYEGCPLCSFCAYNGFIAIMVASTVESMFCFCCAIVIIVTMATEMKNGFGGVIVPIVIVSMTVFICSAIVIIAAAVELGICPYSNVGNPRNCTGDYIVYETWACLVGVLVCNCVLFVIAVSASFDFCCTYGQEKEVTPFVSKFFRKLSILATVLSLLTWLWTLVIMNIYRYWCTPNPAVWSWEIWAITESCAIVVAVPLAILCCACKSSHVDVNPNSTNHM